MMPSDENLDILQNIEQCIVILWREHREMTDHTVLRAYEAAFARYRAELRGHDIKPSGLTGLDGDTFEAVQAMCEFRLGRDTGPEPTDDPAISIEPVPLDRLLDCLRILMKSVRTHTERGGRQGYLTFIGRFLS